MLHRSLFLFIAFQWATVLNAQISVQQPRVENLANPLGLDEKQPRFSWKMAANQRNTLQTHYEIRVGEEETLKKITWTTGKNQSEQSLYVPYGGPALRSNARYYWQVRLWDNKGNVSPWSSTQYWHTGLLDSTAWRAQWIVAPSRNAQASPYLRKAFLAKKKVKTATVFVSAHGVYELHFNGAKVGNDQLTPGWTAYKKRLQYQAYDVTDRVVKGENTLGAILANGWFLGELGWENHRNIHGNELALIAQLEITYTDGTTETIVTDESWKVGEGAVRFSEIYDGERVDLALEPKGWDNAGFDDTKWPNALIRAFAKNILVGTYNEPIKAHETFAPKTMFEAPNGQKVIDFGQNLVGIVRVTAKGSKGTRMVLRYAEVLDPKTGNVYFDNLRKAASSDTFYLSGQGEDLCAARFTFHGFRYMTYEITGTMLQPPRFEAVAWYSDMAPTGNFSCDHPLVNQLQHNIQWGQRGNFLDVPTDCPQRDERLGWTGDAQAFSNTALYNFDTHNFFAKWLKDVAADQLPDGRVPWVIPNVLSAGNSASTGWADAATIIPWNVYVATADRRVLENQYESMKAWVKYMEDNSKEHLWNTGFHFGDWLFYRPEDDNDGRSAVTDKYYIAQCFYAHSIQLVLKTAQVLDKKADIERYTVLLQNVKSAFLNEYITPNGRPVSSTQTAYVLALQFDLLPETQRANIAKALAENIKSYGNHLTTGFLGTPYLCHVLSRFGYDEVAYELLFQESYPSWLYPVKMGATTIWERWDGIKPDSTFQHTHMNSFNHYAYGAIGDWMYRQITGIQNVADAPAYKKIKLAPRLCEPLSFAQGRLESPYGAVASDWRVSNDTLYYRVVVPPNTTAMVDVPTANGPTVRVNGTLLKDSPELLSAPDFSRGGVARVTIGSGEWLFVSKTPVVVQPARLKPYIGRYATSGWLGRSEIKVKSGQMQLVGSKQTYVLQANATAPDLFDAVEGGIKVQFLRNDAGMITGLEVLSEAGTLKGKRAGVK